MTKEENEKRLEYLKGIVRRLPDKPGSYQFYDEERHLKGALLIDVKDSVGFLNKAKEVLPKDKNIMVYCRSGRRSAKAAGMLAAEGYLVYNLKGGYIAWTGAGKEIEK